MTVYDKLAVIQAECAQTGDNPPASEDDGSEEWNVCSPAYDTAIDLTLERHSWNFGTQIATLSRVGASPDDVYTDAYAKPANSLSIVWVRLRANGNVDQSVDWKIIDNQICLNSAGLTPIIKYVVNPGYQNWPPLFVQIIRFMVRAAIYRGLHEDPDRGDKEEAKAEIALREARTRVDQDAPKRALFNGRARAARRVRRPWIPVPAEWSGTDVPD